MYVALPYGGSIIQAITDLHLKLTTDPWQFAMDNRKDIDRHWDSLSKDNPHIWNGTVLMTSEPVVENSRFTASLLKTDYASFIAWRDWGFPDANVFNCFGSAVIISRDGALIYGQMAKHTLNAGLSYPPGGSLDLTDLRPDNTVDVIGSIARELNEETGLKTSDGKLAGMWAVSDGPRISIAQAFQFTQTAEKLLELVKHHIAAEERPELASVVALRSRNCLNMAMPGYAQQLANYLLPEYD